jgi:hypothetical protein
MREGPALDAGPSRALSESCCFQRTLTDWADTVTHSSNNRLDPHKGGELAHDQAPRDEPERPLSHAVKLLRSIREAMSELEGGGDELSVIAEKLWELDGELGWVTWQVGQLRARLDKECAARADLEALLAGAARSVRS